MRSRLILVLFGLSLWLSKEVEASLFRSKRAALSIPPRPEKLRYPPLNFEVPERAKFRYELSGGMVAYVVPDRSLPLVKIRVVFRTGAYREQPGEEGIARLVARLMRNGGAGSLDPKAFDEEVDFLAARMNVTDSDTSVFATLDTLSSVLPQAVDLFVAMLREPRFDEERLRQEKRILLEELRQRGDDGEEVLEREWQRLIYGEESFLTRELTAQDLERIDRKQLLSFHRRTFGRSGTVIAISGDVEPKEILALLDRKLEGFDAEELPPWPPRGPQHQPRPGIYYVDKDIPQGKVLLGHLGVQWQDFADPEMYALMVMNEILGGGGFTSRLMRRIRSDEGLAYDVGSFLSIHPFWKGVFLVRFSSKSGTVARATQIALEEIERIRREPPAKEEVELVQRSIIDAFPRRFDSPAQMARLFAEEERVGRPFDFLNRYRDRIQAVTPEAVQQVAQKYLDPSQLVILWVGKFADMAAGDGKVSLETVRGERPLFALPVRDPLTLRPK